MGNVYIIHTDTHSEPVETRKKTHVIHINTHENTIEYNLIKFVKSVDSAPKRVYTVYRS